MSQEVNNPQVENVNEVANQVPATPKRRRGISNDLQAAARKSFTQDDVDPSTGLFISMINSVKVEWSTGKDDNRDFPNMAIPRLVIDVCSIQPNPQDRRYITKTFFPVPSNVDTCIGGKDEWKVTSILRFMKHMLDVFYLKGVKTLTPEEEASLDLDFYDIDDDGNYEYVEPEVVVKAYGKLFAAFANIMNTANNGKPVYVQPDGKAVVIRTKLLSAIKTKNGWSLTNNGSLDIPSFVGEGIFDIYKADKPSNIKLNAAKESITITESDKKKEPMANPAAGIQVGAPMGGSFGAPMGGGFGNSMPATPAFGEAPAGSDPLPF